MKPNVQLRLHLGVGLLASLWMCSLSQAIPMLGRACSDFKTHFIVESLDPVNRSVIRREVPVPDSSGVLFDRDCTTMYVLPPKTGIFTLSGLARIDAMQFCPMRTKISQAQNDRRDQMKEIERQIFEIDPSDPSAQAKLEFLQGKLLFLQELQIEDDKSLARTSSYQGYFAAMNLEVDWDRLVSNYRSLNPGKQVLEAPLRGSFMTATVTEQDPLGQVVVGGSHYKALESVQVPGIHSIPEPFDWIDGEASRSPVNFAGSMGAQVVLNLPGACPFEEVLEKARSSGQVLSLKDLNREAVKLAMRPYLVANVTYFYPVQTDTKFRISVDIDAIANGLIQVTNRKTTSVSVKDVLDQLAMDHSNAIQVSWEAGAGESTGESILDLVDLKERVSGAIVSDLLSHFGVPSDVLEPIDEVPAPDDPHRIEKMQRYVCHSKSYLFGLKKKTNCHSETYDVKVPTEGWGESVKKFFKDVNISHEENWIVTNTVFQTGTLTFSR